MGNCWMYTILKGNIKYITIQMQFAYGQIETILFSYVLVRRPFKYCKIWNTNFKKFGIKMVGIQIPAVQLNSKCF